MSAGLHPAVGLYPEGAMPRFIIFNFGEGVFAQRVFGVPLSLLGFCALHDARDFGTAFRSVNHRNVALGLHPRGAMPRFIIFNFSKGAFV